KRRLASDAVRTFGVHDAAGNIGLRRNRRLTFDRDWRVERAVESVSGVILVGIYGFDQPNRQHGPLRNGDHARGRRNVRRRRTERRRIRSRRSIEGRSAVGSAARSGPGAGAEAARWTIRYM